jgi:hypothetical protein
MIDAPNEMCYFELNTYKNGAKPESDILLTIKNSHYGKYLSLESTKLCLQSFSAFNIW